VAAPYTSNNAETKMSEKYIEQIPFFMHISPVFTAALQVLECVEVCQW